MDPSHTDEFFPLDEPDMRLDITDAQFLDVIHTEGRFTVPIGHVDVKIIIKAFKPKINFNFLSFY